MRAVDMDMVISRTLTSDSERNTKAFPSGPSVDANCVQEASPSLSGPNPGRLHPEDLTPTETGSTN